MVTLWAPSHCVIRDDERAGVELEGSEHASLLTPVEVRGEKETGETKPETLPGQDGVPCHHTGSAEERWLRPVSCSGLVTVIVLDDDDESPSPPLFFLSESLLVTRKQNEQSRAASAAANGTFIIRAADVHTLAVALLPGRVSVGYKEAECTAMQQPARPSLQRVAPLQSPR